ncbi:MAG: 50S ribosomal protein L10 [Patescibacteria group bacterium]|nr:50S ribosomal protein L10 [Patescibacteria group bacterium]
MSITKQKKGEIIKNLSDKFSKAKSIVFLGFQGLTVKEDEELRNKLRNESIDYKVAKKTLIKRSLKEVKIEDVDDIELEGPVGTAIGYDDEVAPARLANEYAKTNKKLKLLGGYISNKYLNEAQIKALAILPGKDQLRAQLVGTINAPVSGFVNVLAGNIRGLVNVLKAIEDNKK